ncbi:MAG: hypothetical protein K2P79_01630 [Sphingomonas sp.]|nr:hypothetical protein [Sphingomonas sp.]
MRRGAWLAFAATASLALGPPAARAGVIEVPICGDPAHVVRIPLKGDKNQPRDCPAGCHAMCTRRKLAETMG